MMSFGQWGNELYSGKRSYPIVKNGRIWLSIAAVCVIASILLVGFRGLNPSIEFSGGTQFIITQVSDADEDVARAVMAEQGIGDSSRVTTLGSDSIRVQTATLEKTESDQVRQDLADAFGVPLNDVQAASVGASWGQDVTRKAMQSIVIFVILVAVIMTIYFRSWTMSVAALASLANDLVVTVGFFALVQVEVSPATVIGFLTILGYSLYDTVVVFDRIRDVTKDYSTQTRYTYGEMVNLGVNQTLVRSINTSVVALLPVASILVIGAWLLGAGTLTDISLALFVGMLVGAVSSVFVGAPLLSILESQRKRVSAHDKEVLKLRGASVGAADEDVPAPVVAKGGAPRPGQRLPNSSQPKRKKRRR